MPIVKAVFEKCAKGMDHFENFDGPFLENVLNEKFLKIFPLPFMVRGVYTPVFSSLARKNAFCQIMHFHIFFDSNLQKNALDLKRYKNEEVTFLRAHFSFLHN